MKESQPWRPGFPAHMMWWVALLLSEVGRLSRGMESGKEGKWAQFCCTWTFSESSRCKCPVSRWIYWSEAWGTIKTESGQKKCSKESKPRKQEELKGTKSERERSPKSLEKGISIRRVWSVLSGATESPSQIDWKMSLGFSNWRGYWGIESRPSLY